MKTGNSHETTADDERASAADLCERADGLRDRADEISSPQEDS